MEFWLILNFLSLMLQENTTEGKLKLRVNMGQKRINSHPIIHFPTSEGVSKVCKQASKQVSAAEHTSKASSVEQANE